MFGLLTRSHRPRKPLARRSTTLFLERLEDRLSPSGTGGGGGSGPTESISVDVTYLANRYATLSGQLTSQGAALAGHTVNLTGVVTATAFTDAAGKFSITLSIPQLGAEYAADANGQSNTAQVTLAGGSPKISNFTAVAEGSGLWLFSGSVGGAPTQGEVVNFGGIDALQGQSTAVNEDGSFDFYAIVKSGQGGWASADAVDWWGDTSPTASTYVAA